MINKKKMFMILIICIKDQTKQIVKYYAKEYAPDVDPDDIDDREDVLKTFAKFSLNVNKKNADFDSLFFISLVTLSFKSSNATVIPFATA